MKTRVEVDVVCRKYVNIEVEHEEGEDPCDLTKADSRRAIEEAGFEWQYAGDIEIENVSEA